MNNTYGNFPRDYVEFVTSADEVEGGAPLGELDDTDEAVVSVTSKFALNSFARINRSLGSKRFVLDAIDLTLHVYGCRLVF